MNVFADIAHGQANWADIFFLVGVILFAIAAVIAFTVKTFYAVLIAAGLTFVSLAWLLL